MCAACGYSLEGLGAPGRCPECGLAFEARQMVLEGVPNRMRGSAPWRRVAWGVLIVLGVLHSYTWMLQLQHSWSFFLIVSILCLGGLAVMLLTSRRERQGTERFVVTPSGIQRLPKTADAGSALLDPLFVAWGESDHVELKRISMVWRRLRVGRLEGGALRGVVFDAGVRCPDALGEDVLREINDRLMAALRRSTGFRADGRSPEAPTDARGLLQAYVREHNVCVRTKFRGGLVGLFDSRGAMRFEGIEVPALFGAAAIDVAFRERGPDDELVVGRVDVRGEEATAEYRWKRNPLVRAGELRVRGVRGRIVELVVTVEGA